MGAAAGVVSIFLPFLARLWVCLGLGHPPFSCSPGALPCAGRGVAALPVLTCLCPQDLMLYCARDVQATHEVFQQQLPLFMER